MRVIVALLLLLLTVSHGAVADAASALPVRGGVQLLQVADAHVPAVPDRDGTTPHVAHVHCTGHIAHPQTVPPPRHAAARLRYPDRPIRALPGWAAAPPLQPPAA